MKQEQIVWVIDFGSQYTQLITRRCRELGYKSLIMTVEQAQEKLKEETRPHSIILSGGPQSVFEDEEDYSFIFSTELPIFGICYGMQLINQHFGGTVEKGVLGEYGLSRVHKKTESCLQGVSQTFDAWMSHSDHVKIVPDNFDILLESENGIVAGFRHQEKPIFGLQLHPEVHHTQGGIDIIKGFFTEIASIAPDWGHEGIKAECLDIVNQAKDRHVLCAFSGGVDSLVAATITSQLIGDKLYCFFIDNGLLRPQDYHHIEVLKEKTNLNIEVVDAKEQFLGKLKGVSEPETKRKIIGTTFIEVFEQKVHQFESEHDIKFEFLLQGTLYPDIIESISPHKKGGKSVTIKSHHNVGGLPEKMKLKLLEPLKNLFKDEVRLLGEELGLKSEWVHRHPFPGPGIGIRVMGELLPERVKIVQDSDQILFEELKRENLYDSTWQAFTVHLPVKTVGVKGDGRAYEEVVCLRMVNSVDGMTANWTELPASFLSKVSSRITNEIPGVTRVVYDITSKPPGTIEWE